MQVFVSYSPRDKAFAREIQNHLAVEGIKVWRDDRVMPGDNWALAVGAALERSNAMVVLLSPDAMSCDMVRRDIEYALTQIRFRFRLISVLLRPTRHIPWILRQLTFIESRPSPKGALDQIVKALRAPRKSARQAYQRQARVRGTADPPSP
jgi:hypothetical protein